MPNTISHRSTLLARQRIDLSPKWPYDARTFKSVTRNDLFRFSVGYFGAWNIPRILNEPETSYFQVGETCWKCLASDRGTWTRRTHPSHSTDGSRLPLKMFLDKGVRWIFYPLGSPALSTSGGSYLHRRNS